jgi:hypothetical protein
VTERAASLEDFERTVREAAAGCSVDVWESPEHYYAGLGFNRRIHVALWRKTMRLERVAEEARAICEQLRQTRDGRQARG